MAQHAEISPSSFHRLFACHGSYWLTKDIPRKSSIYSERGTALHTCITMMLQNGGKVLPGELTSFELDVAKKEEALLINTYKQALPYYNACDSVALETPLKIAQLTYEDSICTPDFMGRFGEWRVCLDYKFGDGERVYPHDNWQLLGYHACNYLAIPPASRPKRFKSVIIQPGLNDAPLEWDFSEDDLQEFINFARSSVRAISAAEKEPKKHLTPGYKQCRWCPIKATCPALISEVSGALQLAPYKMPIAQLENYYEKLDLYDLWKKAVKDVFEDRLKAGEKAPSYTIGIGREGNREWEDEGKVTDFFMKNNIKLENISSFVLDGPATIEKKFKKLDPELWAKAEKFIYRKPGGLKVVKAENPQLKFSDLTTAGEIKNAAN